MANPKLKQINAGGTLYDLEPANSEALSSELEALSELTTTGYVKRTGTATYETGTPSAASNGAHTHNVTVPTVSKTASKLDLISIIPAVSNGTASKATAGTAKAVATVGTAVSVPNVTGNTDVSATYVDTPSVVSITPATNLSSGKPTRTVFGTATTASKVSISSATASKVSITAKTASKATAGTAVSVATVDTAKTVATGAFTGGTANQAYEAKYDSTNEKLILTPLTASTTTVTPAKSNGTITPYTFADVACSAVSASDVSASVVTASDVSVPVVSSNADVTVAVAGTAVTGVVKSGATTPAVSDVSASKVTLGTALSITPAVSNGSITPYTFSDVTVAKAGTAVSVADGTVSSSGTGSDIVTAVTIGSSAASTTETGAHTHTIS